MNQGTLSPEQMILRQKRQKDKRKNENRGRQYEQIKWSNALHHQQSINSLHQHETLDKTNQAGFTKGTFSHQYIFMRAQVQV